MKKIALLLSITAVLFCSCNRDTGIPLERPDSINALADLTSSIELIPLSTDGIHYIGSRPELLLSGSNYILIDKMNCRIYRYSAAGGFLNSIGTKGNGPGEYIDIDNVQTEGNEVDVFSRPGKMIGYSPDGTFISSSEIKDRGFQSYILDGGILSYYGYGNGRKFRLSYIKGDNVRNLLETKAIVPNFLNMAPAFSKTADGGVAIVDSYNPVICKFKSGKIEPYLKFDFGKYSIPEAFFKYEDPFKASKFLSSNDYALIGRYFENAKYKFAEIAIETKDETEAGFSYGINSDGVWKWFYAGKAGKDPFAASFRTIDDHNTLFCIIDPALADKIPPALMKKVSNPDILQNIKKDDNYIIAKIYLL